MISRKKMLQTSALLAAGAISSQLAAKTTSQVNNAVSSSLDCIANARVCLNHCIEEMGKGNKTLYACSISVQEVVAGCEAFVALKSSGSEFSKEMAALCIKMCEKCEKECNKHAKHHQECAHCAQSCKKCIVDLKSVA